jgi:ferredoxin
MQVHLDRDRCQGHGQCNMAAPDFFVFDDQGFAVLVREDVPVAVEKAVALAELRCPERAITTSV